VLISADVASGEADYLIPTCSEYSGKVGNIWESEESCIWGESGIVSPMFCECAKSSLCRSLASRGFGLVLSIVDLGKGNIQESEKCCISGELDVGMFSHVQKNNYQK
jgi:hypothetical protein